MLTSVTEDILPPSTGYKHTVRVQDLCVSYQFNGKHCLQIAVLQVLFNNSDTLLKVTQLQPTNTCSVLVNGQSVVSEIVIFFVCLL
jgi:hypothetical protein